jgi:hypothetical protein
VSGATSISEAFEPHEADMPPATKPADLERLRRMFYAGALAAAVLATSPEARSRVLGECVDFGRAIGRAA